MPIRKRSGISTGGASLSDMVLSKKNELLNLISQGDGSSLESALQDLGYYVAFLDILYDTTAMNSIVSSSTSMNAIIGSSTALNNVIKSPAAMSAIAGSSTAMNAIINSSTALNTVIGSSTAMYAIAGSATAIDIIIKSQTALNAIKGNSTAWNIFINSNASTVKEVPKMTSNTAPEGVASASSISSSSYDAFYAFDKDYGAYWIAGGASPQWIQYKFVSPVFVHTVMVVGFYSAGNGYNPTSITIQVSNDGSNFTDVATFNQEFTTVITNLYLNKSGYYQYWRVKVNSNVTSSNNPAIRELNFRGFKQPT